RLVTLLLVIVAVLVGLVAAGNVGVGPLVITREGEQKMILFLNEVRKVTTPGWTLRWPVFDTVRKYERRWLYLNTDALPIQTKDGEQLVVDNYAIWRIENAEQFQQSFPYGGEAGIRAAEERIDRVVADDVREVIGRHTLEEVLSDQRQPIMADITKNTRETLARVGIGVAEVRINRTELPPGTEESVYARMKTERERLAKKNRAEGEERARKIRAEADRDAQIIIANARRDAEIARGQGDAEATRIYAEAYSSDAEFYAFLRSLEAYRKTIGEETTLVLSPDSEFFQFLQGSSGK
ncbi:MAG TPA: protease modulator HflC, partial [Myxococcota bacterium]|nr:protease modulator HflC [Myxococcota bacterium]